VVKVDATSLVLTSARTGDTSVTFDSGVSVQKTRTGAVTDIAVGSCVNAQGQKDAVGVVTISQVRVSTAVNGACPQGGGPGGPGGPGGAGGPGGGVAAPGQSARPAGTPRAGQANQVSLRGLVKSVSGTTVTATDASGATITVTVPTTIKVNIQVAATIADVVVGSCVMANGTKDAGGAVAARSLSIVPAGPGGCFAGGGPGGGGGRGNGGGGGGGRGGAGGAGGGAGGPGGGGG
jgi:hypothetical protein